jgi:Pyruvate/2-oxoacid:ferredoxin oxidoreductase delta subunit
MESTQDIYTALAARHGYGDSERYRRILKLLMTPLQAQLVARLPAPPEELAQQLNLGVEEVKKEIDHLFIKGVVIPRDFVTREGARFCRNVLQLHDATEADNRSDETVGAELRDAWEDFCQQEWYASKAQEYAQQEQPQERVLPAYRAIQDIPGISPYDDVREILKAASLIAVVPCSCRRQARKKDSIIESCFQFGRSAEYAIARGSGRKLSYEEALAVVDRAEEDGQVHMWRNWRTLTYGLMCNCTADACVAWTPLVLHQVPIGKRAARSRFQAVVDQGLCDGCQVCIDRCQFDAIDMEKPAGSRKYKAVIDAERCWGCGVCVLGCPPRALSLKLVRPLEHIPEQPPAAKPIH